MADNTGFSINKNYAKNYEDWRRKEELQKLKSRYGDVDIDDEDESSSSEEDEDAEALTEQLEKDWLETLSALRRKDPKIYDQNAKFYHNKEGIDRSADSEDGKEKKKKIKPMLLKDYERKVILEKGGKISDESENEEFEESDEEQNLQKPGYYEEQDDIKKSFKSALVESGSESEDEFLVKRTKSGEEKDKEEKEFDEWRKTDEAQHCNSGEWKSSGVDDGEEFLNDYIINKRYIDRDSSRIPTYEEIVHEDEFSDEEEKFEQFERKYNFRFEEPDQEFIKSYPRTIGDSVRRKDSRRAEKRKEVKERKVNEKEKKKEEIKQLKNLKRKEIMQKLETIKEITGNATLGISEADLEGDFDPNEYDHLMQKAFNEDFYGEEESEKPVLQEEQETELGLDVDKWDEWTGSGLEGEEWEEEGNETYAGDPGFVMDADYDPNAPKDTSNVSKKKKGKKKNKFYQALEHDKPVFDPKEKTFEEYFDEYYKLDYEDIIGDLPCRFKYRQVVPNDFGLSVDEIMKARDNELNSWAALRKSTQYRTDEEERREAKIYKKRSRHEDKKYRILPSLLDEDDATANQKKKRRRKKTLPEDRPDAEPEPEPSTSAESAGRTQQNGEIDRAESLPEKSPNERCKRKAEHSQEVKKSKKHKVSAETGDINNSKKPKVGVETDDSGSNTNSGKKENASVTTQKTGGEKNEVTEAVESTNTSKNKKKKGKKGKKKNKATSDKDGQMTDERVKAYGFNPKTFKYIVRAKLKQTQESVS